MAPTITIDGNNVTNASVSGSWTRRLNRPSQAQVVLPMDAAVGAVGDALKIENLVGTTNEVVFHGRIMLMEVDTGDDFGYVTYNATDPMELWQWRPVRDDTCDFSKPTIVDDYQQGPAILEAMLRNTSGEGGGCCPGCDCEDTDAADCEGPIFLDFGTFEAGGCDLSGAPVDWPMTIAQMFSLMVSTGCLDAVITPTDPGGGVMGTIDAYNGDYGTDLSGSVVFQYGTGAFNMRRFRRNFDMSNMSNKLWYYAGPRIQTAADPAGDQHWCFNVTGDDPLLPDPIPNGTALATLLSNRLTSRTNYGVRMDIQIFDAADDDCIPGYGTFGRNLYRNRWETESWIRQQPRELIHITPTRETEIGTFDIGDIVGVEAVAAAGGGFNGAQRVYAYTVSWEEDGVLALSELQTSPTAD